MSKFEKILTEIPFDFGKFHQILNNLVKGEIRTNEYRKVTIFTTLAKGDYPIAGLVDLGDREVCMQWTLKGKRDTRDFVTTNGDLLLLVEEGGEAV